MLFVKESEGQIFE